MKMEDIILFLKWAVTISAGTIFLLIVSVYLYRDTQNRRGGVPKAKRKVNRLLTDFVFVWVLIGLLVFYVVTIELSSPLIFALGNIAVELLLIVYAIYSGKTSESAC